MNEEDRTPDLRMDGRHAVVTGAARGIGLGIATRFAALGARVTLSDLDGATLEGSVAALRRRGLEVTGVVADVTDPMAVEQLMGGAAEGGGIDVVVANAGQMCTGGVGTTSPELWERGLRVNLTSSFLTARAALPALRRSPRGRLLFLASGAAFDPRTVAGVPYAVAKAGIVHLAAVLAVELAGTATTVNAIAPGAVDTDMARGFGEDVLAGFAARSPLGRIATSDDVADVAVFLASDMGGFVNGQTIRVSGGP